MEPYIDELDKYLDLLNETKTMVNVIGTNHEDINTP